MRSIAHERSSSELVQLSAAPTFDRGLLLYRRYRLRITYDPSSGKLVGRTKPGGGLMASRHAPINDDERKLASVELDQLAIANDGVPWIMWKDAVLQWHVQRLAVARAEAWIPGLADHHEESPAVTKFLDRFYRHQMRVTIGRLRTENIELRRQIVEATKRPQLTLAARQLTMNSQPQRRV